MPSQERRNARLAAYAEQGVEFLFSLYEQLETRIDRIMVNITALTAQVSATNTVMAQTVLDLQNQQAQIAAISAANNDPALQAQIDALTSSLATTTANLVAAEPITLTPPTSSGATSSGTSTVTGADAGTVVSGGTAVDTGSGTVTVAGGTVTS